MPDGTDHRRTVSRCVCGGPADPVYVDDGGGILYVCRARCGFSSRADPVASASQAAEEWAAAVGSELSAVHADRRTMAVQARQVLRSAQLQLDPLVAWADHAAQALPELAKTKLVQSAAVAQAVALVRISQLLAAESHDYEEAEDDPFAGDLQHGEVPGQGCPGVE